MTVPVRYACPRCGAIATIERDPDMADKSVTPFPLEGWTYAAPDTDFEDADGVRFVCGEHTDEGGSDDSPQEGCDEPFYLSFVRFENGQTVEPAPESEYVRLNVGKLPRWPSE